MTLDTSTWGEFRIGDLFEIYKGTRLTKANMLEGKIRFVSAANTNNGITAYVGNNSRVHGEGTLTVCYNGNGGTGKAFYQDKPFWASDDIHVLYPQFRMSEPIGLFLAAVIEKVGRQKYGFTDKWKLEYMREDKIKLPIDKRGKPDWSYIESFMSSMSVKVADSFTALSMADHSQLLLETCNWREFVIGKLFEISRPKSRSQLSYTDGDVAFVASGNVNNGVAKWCQPKKGEGLDAGNCITVSPLDGSSFYHKEAFLGRGGAGSAILVLRCNQLNEQNGLFIATCLRRSFAKYSYADQLNSISISHETVRLPVTISDSPDWDYMNYFMSNVIERTETWLDVLANAVSECQK